MSFEIGPFDRERGLVIDPEIVFSTYLGSNSIEYGEGVAVDKSGAIYVVGDGTSSFPTTPGSYQPGSPWKLGFFLAKLDAAGKKLVWATFIAGKTSASEPYALAVDGAGNVVMTGYANNLDPTQADFPIYPPYQAFDDSFGGDFDAVVVKVSAAGNALIYSTYLGGSGQDVAYDVAVDAQDNAYVVGGTGSAKFPKTAGAHQPALKGVLDAFVSKFDPNGKLLYSTLLGGSSGERALGVRTGGGGAVFVTGWTKSKDFPTKGGWSSQLAGGADVFVSKLQPGATKPLLYSTLLGGKLDEYGYGIGIDSTQNAYVTGMTFSKDFPQKNSIGKFKGGKCPSGWKGACPVDADAFVSGLDASGGSLRYSTFLGGNGFDTARGIAVSQGGRAYVTGWTGSSNFPVKDPFQAKLAGPSDAWFALLTPKGDLELSTLHGGSSWEYGLDVAIDSFGHAMVTGTSKSSDLPVKNAYDPSFNHASATGDFFDADAFLLKLKLHQVVSQPKGFFDWISSFWSQLLGWLKEFFEID